MTGWPFFIGVVEGAACTLAGIWMERRRMSRRMLRQLDAAFARHDHPDEAHWSPDDDQQ